MNINQVFTDAVKCQASDIFIVAGLPLSFKINGEIKPQGSALLPPDTAEFIQNVYGLADRSMDSFSTSGDDDFSFSIKQVGRFRVNAYKQRGSMAAVLRVVMFNLPDSDNLGIPKEVINLFQKTKGLVLVTGPSGSGKSTTLACIIDKINKTRNAHVITLEDPIEFIHRHDRSIVSQREIGMDTVSYSQGLRAALRESPDVILLGEMRDFETISIAMSAAETGQLIFSTLHTLGAANSIDRIIDVFPNVQQQQVRVQLSMVLQAVISQQLIPSTKGELVPAFEVMFVNSAIRNMIRESKIHQIDSVVYASSDEGMRNMDASIFKLYQDGFISGDSAKFYSVNYDMISKKIE